LFRRLTRITGDGFIRSVSILVGGSAVAQLLSLLMLPIVTRLYTPADFSTLAVYSALLTILTAVACLRLEIAIPLPENDSDAVNLLAIALGASLIFSIVIGLIVIIFPEIIAEFLRQPMLAKYLWLLPIGICVTAFYNALQFWTTRKKEFSRIARTRMEQAVGGSMTQIGLGWLGATPLGLLLGQIVSSAAGVFGLGQRALINDRENIHSISWQEMKRVLKRYERFPKISIIESLANNAAIQVPVVLIAAMAIGPEAGYLALAMRVMQAPLGLIGGAISQVYLSRAPEKHRENRLGEFTASILGGLTKTGVGPLIFAGFVAPDVFGLVFGEDWRRAGELVAWMTPWLIFQFLSSPVSMALHVTGQQGVAMGLQCFGLALRVLSVLLDGFQKLMQFQVEYFILHIC